MIALLQALKDEDGHVRWQAARSLGRLRQSSSEVIADLLHLLKDNDGRVRYWAAYSLSQLGQSSASFLPSLFSTLSNEDLPGRYEVALALGKLDQGTEKGMVTIVDGVLKADDDLTRWDSARFLGRRGQSDEETIQRLFDRLLNDERQVQQACAEALAQLRRRFPDALERIEKGLVQIIRDQELAELNSVKGRFLDSVYEGLWLLVVGGEFEGV